VISVRRAVPADAPALSAVLIASITELCATDHRNDAEAIANWLANKSPARVAEWFANPANTMLVAERDGEIAACGAFNDERKIILNYVSPHHRFAGVSKALLAAMEAGLGPGEATLSSTLTAHRFYRAAGWEDAGAQYAGRFIDAIPMRKIL
jgi:GNAT superfamily N-acetyltransferase